MLKLCRTLIVLTAALAVMSGSPALACEGCDAHKAAAAAEKAPCPHAKAGEAPCADCPHAKAEGKPDCAQKDGAAEDCPCKKAAQEGQKL